MVSVMEKKTVISCISTVAADPRNQLRIIPFMNQYQIRSIKDRS